jgi:predicted transcriptional regulator
MAKQLTPADLPEDVARLAVAQVAAGRFATIEDVVRAGVYALAQPDELLSVEDEEVFVAAVREGHAQIARGEGIPHAQVMARAAARLAEHARRRPQ